MRTAPFAWATKTAVLVFGLSILGCGDESSTGPGRSVSDLGSFELSFSGDTSGTMSGIAWFSEHRLPTGGLFHVVFGRDFSEAHDADTGFQLGRDGPLPASGTFDLTGGVLNTDNWPERSFGLGIQLNSPGSTRNATSGTVTFTEVNSDRIRGEFSATLTGNITATGTFDACEDTVENCP